MKFDFRMQGAGFLLFFFSFISHFASVNEAILLKLLK